MSTRPANEVQAPKVNTHKNGWGGARRGAGNSHVLGGGVNSLKNEVLTLRAKYKKMPLDHMLKVLNTDPPELPKKTKANAAEYELLVMERESIIARQDWAATAAAPYMHAKLASIEVSVAEGGSPVRHEVDLTKLSEDELDHLETLVNKATADPKEVTLDDGDYHEVE